MTSPDDNQISMPPNSGSLLSRMDQAAIAVILAVSLGRHRLVRLDPRVPPRRSDRHRSVRTVGDRFSGGCQHGRLARAEPAAQHRRGAGSADCGIPAAARPVRPSRRSCSASRGSARRRWKVSGPFCCPCRIPTVRPRNDCNRQNPNVRSAGFESSLATAKRWGMFLKASRRK
jgi:hypothetical protein